MPLMSDQRVRRREGEGFVQQLQAAADQLAEQKVDEARLLSQAAGLPWGSERVGETDALARIDEYEAPDKVKAVDELTDAQVVRAAIDAVRRRERALKSGKWTPGPQVGALAPQPEAPAAAPPVAAPPQQLPMPGI